MMQDLRYFALQGRRASYVGVGALLTVGGFCRAGWADTQSLLSSADAYVKGGSSANQNFGADLDLQAKFSSVAGTFHRKDYIRFNLTSVTNAILASSLRLTVSDSLIGTVGSPAQVYTFHVYGLNDGAGDNWVEGTGTTAAPTATGITWNNAPANNTASGNALTGVATSLGTFTLTGRGIANQQVNFSSAALTTFLNADTNNLATVIITRDTQEINAANSVVHTFASRERGASGPTLNVTTADAAPEPGALALMGVGLLGAGIFRRRRNG